MENTRCCIVDDDLSPSRADNVGARRIRSLIADLKQSGIQVVESCSHSDGLANVTSDSSISLLMVNWNLGKNNTASNKHATDLLTKARSRNRRLPIFLIVDRKVAHAIPLKVMELVSEFVWLLEDSSHFIAGRAHAAINRYLEDLLPPLAKAMVKYASTNEYSWAAPGHAGGVAFSKDPAGRVFYDFFGENLFRTDIGIEREALGSLLDHTGPMGAAEKYQAYVFGSHRTYSGVFGSSGSNRVIFSACVHENEIALCDRNCHKSIEQGLVVTGAIPQYMIPTRNKYGIIGPILPSQFTPQAIKEGISKNPLAKRAKSQKPVYAVVTNTTYDGLCYHAKRAEELLGQVVDRLHFDEAWYGYARFNNLYADRFAMRGNPKDHNSDGPTIFATQSTHKLLAALSQASFIHVRDGRSPIPHSIFNEAYQLHSTTSPLYAIAASNDISACMMDHGGGKTLTDESIREAVAFRQALMRTYNELKGQGSWFFHPWNAWEVFDPVEGAMVKFDHAKPDLLTTDQNCWVLHPNQNWHGFQGLEENWCMLDPIKVGIVTPGMDPDGTMHDNGIPAALVTAFLGERGIIVARTTDFMVLFLFSIGITKGKWGTLLSSLLSFRHEYDKNAQISHVLPHLVEEHFQGRYDDMGLKDLCDEMFAFKKENRQTDLLHHAYEVIPKPEMRPRDAFEKLMKGEVDLVPLSEMDDRIAAVSIIPYPPGIPMVMPGERITSAQLDYLKGMNAFDKKFPGFSMEIQGVDIIEGEYHVYCLKEDNDGSGGGGKKRRGSAEGSEGGGKKGKGST